MVLKNMNIFLNASIVYGVTCRLLSLKQNQIFPNNFEHCEWSNGCVLRYIVRFNINFIALHNFKLRIPSSLKL